jgi:Tfp pilus assembly protein PilV
MNSEKGQSLTELVIVMAVAIIIVGALTFATIATLRNAQFSKNQAQATKLAQEGIERIRSGRDRNALISSLGAVKSWSGDGTAGSDVWSAQIYNGCGSAVNCYFKFDNTVGSNITWIASSTTFPSAAESVNGILKRAIILSDVAASYGIEKQVAVIVEWTDFAGTHESRLTTVLRKI